MGDAERVLGGGEAAEEGEAEAPDVDFGALEREVSEGVGAGREGRTQYLTLPLGSRRPFQSSGEWYAGLPQQVVSFASLDEKCVARPKSRSLRRRVGWAPSSGEGAT